jgi:hypothetical protein
VLRFWWKGLRADQLVPGIVAGQHGQYVGLVVMSLESLEPPGRGRPHEGTAVQVRVRVSSLVRWDTSQFEPIDYRAEDWEWVKRMLAEMLDQLCPPTPTPTPTPGGIS